MVNCDIVVNDNNYLIYNDDVLKRFTEIHSLRLKNYIRHKIFLFLKEIYGRLNFNDNKYRYIKCIDVSIFELAGEIKQKFKSSHLITINNNNYRILTYSPSRYEIYCILNDMKNSINNDTFKKS